MKDLHRLTRNALVADKKRSLGRNRGKSVPGALVVVVLFLSVAFAAFSHPTGQSDRQSSAPIRRDLAAGATQRELASPGHSSRIARLRLGHDIGTGYPTNAEVEADVIWLSKQNGVDAPTSITAYATTRSLANSIIGNVERVPQLPMDTPEILAFAYGDFVGYGAHVSEGMQYPTGHILFVTATSSAVMDWGIIQDLPSLPSTLGKPIVISR